MLEKYRKKRDFEKTPEPSGKSGKASPALSFVVQKHSARNLHYDFRLECDGVLKSWAVPKGPALDPKVRRLAVAVEDHPLDYIDFEGVIPKGQYGGGEVIVWDTGRYEPLGDPKTKKAAEKLVRDGLEEGKLSFYLFGEKMHGEWTLVHTHDQNWLLIKKGDEEAGSTDITLNERSVLSGLSNEDLKTGHMAKEIPKSIKPMLAASIDHPFDDSGWSFEIKLDGIRALAYVHDGKATLISRTGGDLSSKFPQLIEELIGVSDLPFIVDGEIVLFDEKGKPDFQSLMRGDRIIGTRDADYCVFDLLFLNGEEMLDHPWSERREMLEQLHLRTPKIRVLDTFREHGKLLYEQAIKLGLEGVVAKRIESPYREGSRNGDWLKIKDHHSEEFLICGFTAGTGNRQDTFGSLLLGRFEDGELKYHGNVGTGFNEKSLKELRKALNTHVVEKSPFSSEISIPDRAGEVTWVKPTLNCEVRFDSWTKDKRLRMPVFLRLRPDVPVVNEATTPSGDSSPLVLAIAQATKDFDLDIEGHKVHISHPEKELWPADGDHPAVHKKDLIDYLIRISGWMLPHLKDRPISFVRYPDGITGESFFQRRWEKNLPPFVETVSVWSDHNHRAVPYVMCNNLATLVWLGQLAALEIHPWYSRCTNQPDAPDLGTKFDTESALDESSLSFPDFVVCDLDPNIPMGPDGLDFEPKQKLEGWKRTVHVAMALHEMLESLKLDGFVKTSGKTGLHIYIPIKRIYDYDSTRGIAETLGRHLMAQMPADITMEWSLTKRPNKVFFDHNQNVRGKTLAAAYSPRPVVGAPVSFPLAWDEVERISPADFTMSAAVRRVEKFGDLWANILENRQTLDMS